MQENEFEFLTNTFLFKGKTEEEVERLIRDVCCYSRAFTKGATVFSSDTDGKAIGFIIEGVCEVLRIRSDEEPIPLNTLKKHSSFGIISIFSDSEEFPTVIKAKTAATVLFFDEKSFKSLISKDGALAMNVIAFLCGKISFLNEKIATFSEKSTCSKLRSYLSARYKQGYTEIMINATKLSAALGVGRASLYRDVAALEKEGTVTLENKKIIILNPQGLERN